MCLYSFVFWHCLSSDGRASGLYKMLAPVILRGALKDQGPGLTLNHLHAGRSSTWSEVRNIRFTAVISLNLNQSCPVWSVCMWSTVDLRGCQCLALKLGNPGVEWFISGLVAMLFLTSQHGEINVPCEPGCQAGGRGRIDHVYTSCALQTLRMSSWPVGCPSSLSKCPNHALTETVASCRENARYSQIVSICSYTCRKVDAHGNCITRAIYGQRIILIIIFISGYQKSHKSPLNWPP